VTWCCSAAEVCCTTITGIDETTLLRHGHWGLSLCAALPVLAAVHDKPFAIAGVGVGPLSSAASRGHARVIAERASAITVRDDGSRALLETLSPRLPSTRVTADLAFLTQVGAKGERHADHRAAEPVRQGPARCRRAAGLERRCRRRGAASPRSLRRSTIW
jgi:polysaccharide pyruvyl transferase WcaK-like protein